MGSNFNNKVHFNDSTSLDIDSGGQVLVALGANVQFPVIGSTVSASTDVATGTTLPNCGVVVLGQVAPSTSLFTRTFTVKAPVKGAYLDLIICTTASTEGTIDINLGSGVGVLGNANTTSKQWIIATTDGSPAGLRALNLVGLSTSLWGVVGMFPSSTGWLFVATSS
jgi:hypothetical protein